MKENRAQFATRLGVIATTVGSAVGLGNIWRFPYETGVHGGGAVLLIFYTKYNQNDKQHRHKHIRDPLYTAFHAPQQNHSIHSEEDQSPHNRLPSGTDYRCAGHMR